MKIKEVIYKLRQLYEKKTTDDSVLRNRIAYKALLDARATLLRQMSVNNQFISPFAYQTISRVKLVPKPIHGLEGLPKGLNVIRTEQQLPQMVTDYNQSIVTHITSLDGAHVYQPVNFESLKYQKGRRYNKNTPGFLIRNRYLYLTSLSQEQLITISAIFFNPIEVYSYNEYLQDLNINVPYLDRDFPFDMSKSDALFQMAYNNLIVPFANAQEDMVNDSESTKQ